MTFKELMFNQTGYECFTTFFEDFTIAEKFGVDAVRIHIAEHLKSGRIITSI